MSFKSEALDSFSIELKDKEYRLFADLIYERSGICLGDSKHDLLRARLMKRLKALQLTSYRAYYDFVLKDPTRAEIDHLLDAISTNTTSFFREQQHFDFLTTRAFPEIISRNREKGNRKIRIWSSACSSGEETCSILITLLEFLQGAASDWDIKIIGTDISHKALIAAQRAEYEHSQQKGTALPVMNKYFDFHAENGKNYLVLKDAYRPMVLFRRFNLVTDPFNLKNFFDLIFCRNVMIYFDRVTRENLVNKLCQSLKPRGYFITGHSESLLGMKSVLRVLQPSIYVKEGV